MGNPEFQSSQASAPTPHYIDNDDIIAQAYLLNKAHDLRAEVAIAEGDAKEIEERLKEQAYAEIDALADSEGVEGDDLLRAYQAALLKLNHRSREVRHFEEMLEFRSQLNSGTVFFGTREGILTVADSDGIAPVVKHVEANSNAPHFGWLIAVEERDSPVLVEYPMITGQEEIVKMIRSNYDGYGDIGSPERLLTGIKLYEQVGEVSAADHLKLKALEVIDDYFDDRNLSGRMLSSYETRNFLDTLYEIDEGEYEVLINKLKRYASAGLYKEQVAGIVAEHADGVARRAALAEGATEYRKPLQSEVAQLYADFAKEGDEIRRQAAREAQAANELE